MPRVKVIKDEDALAFRAKQRMMSQTGAPRERFITHSEHMAKHQANEAKRAEQNRIFMIEFHKEQQIKAKEDARQTKNAEKLATKIQRIAKNAYGTGKISKDARERLISCSKNIAK